MKTAIASILCGGLFLACGPGPAGPAGPAGPQGPPGAPGITLMTTVRCKYSTGGYFEHSMYKFSDGSVMATCEVADNVYSISKTEFYKPSMSGAAVGGCIVFNDWDTTGSAGYWVFENNASANSSTATYKDSSSPQNLTSRTLPCMTY